MFGNGVKKVYYSIVVLSMVDGSSYNYGRWCYRQWEKHGGFNEKIIHIYIQSVLKKLQNMIIKEKLTYMKNNKLDWPVSEILP